MEIDESFSILDIKNKILVSISNCSNRSESGQVAYELSQLPRLETVFLLESVITDPSDLISNIALDVICIIDESRAILTMAGLSYLKEWQWDVSYRSISLRSQELLPILLRILDTSPTVGARHMAANAILAIGGQSCVYLLEQYKNETDTDHEGTGLGEHIGYIIEDYLIVQNF